MYMFYRLVKGEVESKVFEDEKPPKGWSDNPYDLKEDKTLRLKDDDSESDSK